MKGGDKKMKTYVVKETICRYHQIEVDDEIDIDNLLKYINYNTKREDTCTNIEIYLKKYDELLNTEHKVLPSYCGEETLCVELYDGSE